MLEEGLSADKDKCVGILEKEIGKLKLKEAHLFTFDEFSRLFTKDFIRKALVDIAEAFTSRMQKNGALGELPLGK